MGARTARAITTAEGPEGKKVELIKWKTLCSQSNSSPSEVPP